jgi:hypothetical protein
MVRAVRRRTARAATAWREGDAVGQQGDRRDAMRDQVDDLEAAAKRLEGDTPRHTGEARAIISDDRNAIRDTLGTVAPAVPAERGVERADDARRA